MRTISLMAKTYRSYELDQLFLMPPSLRDWLPEDHLAYFVGNSGWEFRGQYTGIPGTVYSN